MIEETFKELSLEAHHQKTDHDRDGDWIQETSKQIEEYPAKIHQSFKIKVVHSEKYLGHIVVSGTLSDIIDANIKMNARKVHQVATEIRQEVQDPRIERIGSLKASSLLIQ